MAQHNGAGGGRGARSDKLAWVGAGLCRAVVECAHMHTNATNTYIIEYHSCTLPFGRRPHLAIIVARPPTLVWLVALLVVRPVLLPRAPVLALALAFRAS